MRIAIRDLIIDPSIDIREGISETVVQEYMDVFERLPQVVVFDSPDGLLLSDGFHRTSAAQRLGHTEIEAEVRKGTRNDALEYAAHANAVTGLRLTSEERRVGIRRLHTFHSDWPHQQIADLMGCSRRSVDDVVRNLQVYREAPSASLATDSHVREISRAPSQQWEPLAKVVTEKEWSVEETREAVRNLADPAVPAEHKQALLQGETEPVAFREGGPVILRQTIQRHLSVEAKQDYRSFMEGSLQQLAQLRRFSAQEIVDGVSGRRLSYRELTA